jgi:hypothetical protein
MRTLVIIIFISAHWCCIKNLNEDSRTNTLEKDSIVKPLIFDVAILGHTFLNDSSIIELDSITCSIKNYNFVLSHQGLIKWGPHDNEKIQLKTDVFIEQAYFYVQKEILYIFYTETDYLSGTSRVEKINLKSGSRIWKQEIFGFNLGQPYFKNDYVYISSIGNVGKLHLENGNYEFQFLELYDHEKISFNSFDTIIFRNRLTYFLSKNFTSNRIDSVIVNELTKELLIVN